MATRNGKIANLPNDIREQLNLRLLEGESGRELAAWLNALPAVQSVLGSHFNASPISEVNLTLWRQGGYLQWLTERECFDSASALADEDGNLAETGLSVERLLNVLTVRFGELLMRWDFSPDETVSDAAEPTGVGAGGMSREEASPFSEVARKARILQGISRSLLAIHRIQSQSPRQKSEPARSSAAASARPENPQPNPATAGKPPKPQLETQPKRAVLPPGNKSEIRIPKSAEPSGRGAGGGKGQGRAIPTVLSGPIIPVGIPPVRPQISFKPDLHLREILDAV
jgi:hypothetical protein